MIITYLGTVVIKNEKLVYTSIIRLINKTVPKSITTDLPNGTFLFYDTGFTGKKSVLKSIARKVFYETDPIPRTFIVKSDKQNEKIVCNLVNNNEDYEITIT